MKPLNEMTWQEKQLRHIIIDYRNDFIGSFENMTYDNDEETCEKYWPLKNRTKQYVCNDIYDRIMKGKDDYVQATNDWTTLEKKHIRFMGETFVRELIENRVQADFDKHGWPFENNFYGDLK